VWWIPRPLERQILVDAGHRCAIPTCRQTPIEIHHIVPWAQLQEHAAENLIALCRNDHGLAEQGKIDRQSLIMYKANLRLLTDRYGDLERRVLEEFRGKEAGAAVALPGGLDS
jgi:HNH endonuclease